MSHKNIVRAWKDENYRNNLTAKERTLLPEHPAGLIELTDVELDVAAGGRPPLSAACSYTPNCD